jgi:hypothetical protein
VSVTSNEQAARVLDSITAEQADQDGRRYTPSTDKAPTVKQVYRMARELCAIAEIAWPASRAEASAIIDRLIGQSTAVDAVQDGRVDPDDLPPF